MTEGLYEQPLDSERMAAEQAAHRAGICDRLETMWQGLQVDIEAQRHGSERGVDPRLQQLQLQVLKLDAQLWRMLAPPLPTPPPAPDPQQARVDAMALVLAGLDEVAAEVERAAAGPAPADEPQEPPDTSWITMGETA